MKGTEGTPTHEESEALAVCVKEFHIRLTRPNGKIQDLHLQGGDVRWVWEDTRIREKPWHGAVGDAAHRDEGQAADF